LRDRMASRIQASPEELVGDGEFDRVLRAGIPRGMPGACKQPSLLLGPSVPDAA
jgi:hypothetical protein